MGVIKVRIENESGNRISEPVMVPSNIFPPPTDCRFCCLRFIDPYGDATFNYLQMPFVLADLQLLKKELRDDEIEQTLDDVEALAKACEAGVRLHLRFMGD